MKNEISKEKYLSTLLKHTVVAVSLALIVIVYFLIQKNYSTSGAIFIGAILGGAVGAYYYFGVKSGRIPYK